MRFLACFLFSISMTLSGMVYAQTMQTQPTSSFAPLPANHPLNDPDLSTFRELINNTGVYNLFQGTGPFTAFVPSNAAMEKYGRAKLVELKKPKNEDQLTDLLLYHVVPGKYLTQYIKPETVRTINGKTLTLGKNGTEVRVNNARIIKADLEGPNGVVHIIDTVLTP